MTRNDDAPGTDDRTRAMSHSEIAMWPCCAHCAGPGYCPPDGHTMPCACQLHRRKDSE